METTDPVAILKLIKARCANDAGLFELVIIQIQQAKQDAITVSQFLNNTVQLLSAFPDLVLQLNNFLPTGYGVLFDSETGSFNISEGDQDQAKVQLQPLFDAVDEPEVAVPLGAPFQPTFNDARAFLRLVKARLEPIQPMLYEEFMDSMEEHRRSKSKKKTRKLKCRLVNMFKVDYPDLLFVMRLFLPETEQIQVESSALTVVQYSPLLPLYARFVPDVFVPAK